MKHKQASGRLLKATDQGRVTAVFATLNVRDSDKDVTRPGAFVDAAPNGVRLSAWNHASWGGELPVGKGTIHEDGNEAILEGQFFMDTTAGRETFAVVRELAPNLGEWSYGYEVLESSQGDFEGEQVTFLEKLEVFEVSPVLLGAGVDTRTLAVKRARTAASTRDLAGIDRELGAELAADELAQRSELREVQMRVLLRDCDWERLSELIP